MASKRAKDMVLGASDDRPQVVGGRLIGLLAEQLAAMGASSVHGNRRLMANHVVVAHLIGFFNPAIDSLRTVEDVFEHASVRRRMGLPRVPKSTLADAQRLFDVRLLEPLVADLAGRLSLTGRSQLDPLTRKIIAVDATVFQVAGRIRWALSRNSASPRGAVQMCLHLDVLDGVPDSMTLISERQSERSELSAAIKTNRLYLLDRAYQSYDHLNAIAAIDSDFVVRLRKTARFEFQQTHTLSATDRRAGVCVDAVVRPADRHHRFEMPVRLVEINADDGGDPVRLLTNRLDLSAEMISQLYRHRWQIELFFRWLKCVAGVGRFFSETVSGMTVQLYVAMIGMLLIALETDSKPSKYDFAQIGLVVNGAVTLDEAKRVMARRRAERTRAAQRQAERRAQKQANH